jgi:hypothetical protein
LSSVVAYVVKYIGPLDSHVCLSWLVVFSLLVFCAVCLVLSDDYDDHIGRNVW